MTITLTKRSGQVIKSPRERDLVAALRELGVRDPKHPECWLSDRNGWTITAYEDGRLLFDNVETGEGPWHLPPASMGKALALMKLLTSGNLGAIKKEPWIDGYGHNMLYPSQQGLRDDARETPQDQDEPGLAGTDPDPESRASGMMSKSFALFRIVALLALAAWGIRYGITSMNEGVISFEGRGFAPGKIWIRRADTPLYFWYVTSATILGAAGAGMIGIRSGLREIAKWRDG